MSSNPVSPVAMVINPADCHILVVDDSENVLELVVMLLTSQKYRVSSAHSALEALNWLQSNTADLIITDLMMPDIDGLELTSRIRQAIPHFIPIIMFTASNNEQDRIKALTKGADDFLTKPINRYELQARVRNLLRLKKIQDSLVTALQDRENFLKEVTDKYLELEANSMGASAPVETMLATIRAVHNQLRQPVQSAQTLIELAAQNYMSPGRELDLALNELARISKTLQGLEEVARSGKL